MCDKILLLVTIIIDHFYEAENCELAQLSTAFSQFVGKTLKTSLHTVVSGVILDLNYTLYRINCIENRCSTLF